MYTFICDCDCVSVCVFQFRYFNLGNICFGFVAVSVVCSDIHAVQYIHE